MKFLSCYICLLGGLANHLSRLKQVHMYLRGSGKAAEMKHDAAISTMMAAFRQAMNNGHRNCASHIGAQI
ncbi:hypothetical protein Tco_0781618 [Tanacetum coccineum]